MIVTTANLEDGEESVLPELGSTERPTVSLTEGFLRPGIIEKMPNVFKGLLAGMGAGIAGSWMMLQFQRMWSHAAQGKISTVCRVGFPSIAKNLLQSFRGHNCCVSRSSTCRRKTPRSKSGPQFQKARFTIRWVRRKKRLPEPSYITSSEHVLERSTAPPAKCIQSARLVEASLLAQVCLL